MADEAPHERVLLVEGPDDKHVAIHVSRSSPDMPDFLVIDKGGIHNLLHSIPLEIRVEGRVAVGILVDANCDLQSRWQAVTDRLNRLRREDHPDLPELPDRPEPTGTIIEGAVRIGIWLMPDNRSSGELEDFVARMIPSADPVWPLSEAYIDGIPPAARKFALGKIQRAKVHAWLATREDPRRMGLAIKAGDLDPKAANAAEFADWLRTLFT
jgi:hypothetical protein